MTSFIFLTNISKGKSNKNIKIIKKINNINLIKKNKSIKLDIFKKSFNPF